MVKFFLYVKEIHNWILGEFQKPHCIMVSFFFYFNVDVVVVRVGLIFTQMRHS